MSVLYKADGSTIEIGDDNTYSIGVDSEDEKLYLYVDGEKSGEGIEINPADEVI